jgi:hypothetical protein
MAMRPFLLGVLCTGALACSGSPPAPPGLATASVASVAAPPPADVTPRIVVQGLVAGEMTFSPDARHLAIVSDGLVVARVKDGRATGRFPRCVSKAAFSPDGGTIYALGCPTEPQAALPMGTSPTSPADDLLAVASGA